MIRVLALLSASACLQGAASLPQGGGELRFAISNDPRTLDPLMVSESNSFTVRHLTSGYLLRINRRAQKLEGDLATSWKVLEGGRKIVFELRKNVLFSDGSRFTPADVVHTVTRAFDPKTGSPIADAFATGETPARPEVKAEGASGVSIRFASPIAGLERLFDGFPILSAHASSPQSAGLGPFQLAENQAGAYLRFKRNPNYWKKDAEGRQLPYLDSVRLEILRNREVELLRVKSGELHLMTGLDADMFERLKTDAPGLARDLGPSMESEQFWFNQNPAAPIPAHKREWFRSTVFRKAVSDAINRGDIARVVFKGHAKPSAGPVTPANQFWFNRDLKPLEFAAAVAAERLKSEGFAKHGGQLFDKAGNPVEFSIVTNAGNKTRERIAAMMQQDLAALGIRVSILQLDFPALIERISRNYQYETCLLALTNVDLDPNGQMNIWLSSGADHPWNPREKTPATPWEAKIDKLMRQQASTLDPARRKAAWDEVQRIAVEQAPFVYLVDKNALAAIHPSVGNAEPQVIEPKTYWNIDQLYLR